MLYCFQMWAYKNCTGIYLTILHADIQNIEVKWFYRCLLWKIILRVYNKMSVSCKLSTSKYWLKTVHNTEVLANDEPS